MEQRSDRRTSSPHYPQPKRGRPTASPMRAMAKNLDVNGHSRFLGGQAFIGGTHLQPSQHLEQASAVV
jgi:hypothetical protein